MMKDLRLCLLVAILCVLCLGDGSAYADDGGVTGSGGRGVGMEAAGELIRYANSVLFDRAVQARVREFEKTVRAVLKENPGKSALVEVEVYRGPEETTYLGPVGLLGVGDSVKGVLRESLKNASIGVTPPEGLLPDPDEWRLIWYQLPEDGEKLNAHRIAYGFALKKSVLEELKAEARAKKETE